MNRRLSSKKYLFLGIVIISAVLLFSVAIFVPLETIILDTAGAAFKGVSGVGIFDRFTFHLSDRDELERLRMENSKLALQVERSGISASSHPTDFIEAAVVAKRADSFQNTLILNKGSADGVRVGARIVADGFLLAYVKDLGKNFSKAKLITSPDFEIQGVFARSGIPALLEGAGGGMLRAKAPRGADITSGDVVVQDTAETYIIGRVMYIDDTPQDPFMKILISTPVNTLTIKNVNILINESIK